MLTLFQVKELLGWDAQRLQRQHDNGASFGSFCCRFILCGLPLFTLASYFRGQWCR
jgi:hypothetical protein